MSVSIFCNNFLFHINYHLDKRKIAKLSIEFQIHFEIIQVDLSYRNIIFGFNENISHLFTYLINIKRLRQNLRVRTIWLFLRTAYSYKSAVVGVVVLHFPFTPCGSHPQSTFVTQVLDLFTFSFVCLQLRMIPKMLHRFNCSKKMQNYYLLT